MFVTRAKNFLKVFVFLRLVPSQQISPSVDTIIQYFYELSAFGGIFLFVIVGSCKKWFYIFFQVMTKGCEFNNDYINSVQDKS